MVAVKRLCRSGFWRLLKPKEKVTLVVFNRFLNPSLVVSIGQLHVYERYKNEEERNTAPRGICIMDLLSGLAVTTLATMLAVWINDKFEVGGPFPDEIEGTATSSGHGH